MTTQDNTDKSSRFFDGFAVAGTWEPVMQRLRMGSAPADWRERYEEEFDEEWVRSLAERGVTMLMLFYSKGFGPQTETPLREQGKQLADLAHKYGMMACAYLSDTVMLETFSLEEPDVVNWLQVNAYGDPIHYGGDQTHRRRGCFNNPQWRAYQKGMIKRAHDDGFEATQPDNDIWWPEPDGCRCQHCRDRFRQFVKERYPTAEESIDRFGLPTLDAVDPPVYSNWFKPYDLDGIRNPMIQEWIRFRCHSIQDFRRELWEFAQAECPGMSVLMPSSGITNRNMPWLHGEDHNLTVGITPTWSTEEPLPCVYDEPTGVLGCKIRSMRLARRTGTIMMHNAYVAHEGPAKPEAMLAEGLAFNQGALGGVAAFHWGSKLWPEYNSTYLSFLKEHRELLTHVDGMAEVALLRSSATLAFEGIAVRTCTTLMEQLLIQSNVIFELILDRHLDALDRYRVLVLPGMTCTSDANAAKIAQWVAAGGRLLATDAASTKDEWRRARPYPALAEVFGWPTDGEIGGCGPVQCFCTYGKGLAAYVPKIEFDLGEPDADNQFYKAYKWNRWRLPENSVEILSLLRQLGYDQLLMTFPRWVACELVKPQRAPGVVLHAVNYRKDSRIGRSVVSLRRPEDWGRVDCVALSPEWDGVRALAAGVTEDRVEIATPEFEHHCLLHIKPG